MKKKFYKQIALKLTVAVLGAGMLALSCIFLMGLPKYILLLAIILFSSLTVIITSLDYHAHETLFKILFVTFIAAALALVGFIVLDRTSIMEKLKDADAIIEFIRGTRHWGILVFIFFVIFQVIFLPLPTAVTAFIGSKLYGPTWAFIYMTIGTIIGSLIAFALGKVFGQKLVIWMIGKEKTEKYAEILNRKGRFLFIVMMLLPFFPDDILCLVAGITAMSYGYFLLVISLTRPVMIAFTCYFVEGSIIPFSGWGIPVWIAIFAAFLVLFIIIGRVKKIVMDRKSDKSENKDEKKRTPKEKKKTEISKSEK